MKKISVVLVAVMFLSTGNLFANKVTNGEDTSKSLSVQISQMLSKNTFTQNDVEQTAQVRFTLNNEHQIVVLSVETENTYLEAFVKDKLNYQKVDLEVYREGKIYTVPVRIAI